MNPWEVIKSALGWKEDIETIYKIGKFAVYDASPKCPRCEKRGIPRKTFWSTTDMCCNRPICGPCYNACTDEGSRDRSSDTFTCPYCDTVSTVDNRTLLDKGFDIRDF